MAENDQRAQDGFDALLRQTLCTAWDAVPVQADWPALAALLAARPPPQVASSRIFGAQPPMVPQDDAYRPLESE